MSPEDRYTRHARLVSQMADKVGLDVIESMQRGELDSEDLRNMVHSCEGCTDPEACERMMASGVPVENPPEYCRNSERLSQWKR